MMKKCFIGIMLLIFVLGFHSVSAVVQTGSGMCGEGVSWSIAGDDTEGYTVTFMTIADEDYSNWMDNCKGIIPNSFYDEDIIPDRLKVNILKNENGKMIRLGNSQNIFSGLEYVTEMDLTGLDFSNTLSMQFMFKNCTRLTAVDVSGWNTSRVEMMGNMFQGCTALTSIDLSSWNISM